MVAAVYAVARHRIAGPAVIVAGAVATGALVWFADPTTPGGIIPPCPTNALLHLNCPGCGTSRMLYSLMHGDFGAAVSYNAFGLVALVLLPQVGPVAWWAHIGGLIAGAVLVVFLRRPGVPLFDRGYGYGS